MKTLPLAAGASLGLALACPAFSQALLFDFGPNSAASTAARTNSPAHATGDVSATETTWNQVQLTDMASGLKYASGADATGVSIDLGVETTSSSNIIGYATQPNSQLLGNNGAYSTGIYNPADSPSRDFIYNSANNEPWAVGIKVSGLAAGDYRIYVAGANVNGATAGTMDFFAAAIASGGSSFDFGALSPSSATNLSASAAAWSAGVNYAVFSISITAGQDLVLAASGTGASAGGRGFLNSVEIVSASSIPEPGTSVSLAGVVALLAVTCGRRRRGALRR